jgi:hypothetical protein
MTLPNKYGDFADLEELEHIMNDRNLIAAYGKSDKGPHAGPYIAFSSPNSQRGYAFIKKPDGTYTVTIHQKELPKHGTTGAGS